MLSLVFSKGWSFRQLDINNAFHQGTLTEFVYMSHLHAGFLNKDYPNYVCKLHKPSTGLNNHHDYGTKSSILIS